MISVLRACFLARWGLGLPLIFVLTGYVSAAYFTYSDVTELSAANFDQLVVNSDGVALVHFYAPGNPQCKSLASRINSVASNLKGIALVGAVDCTDKEAAGNLCQRYNVRGFPAVKLFGPDRTKNPYTGEVMKEPSDYTGDRTSKDLKEAVTRLLTDVHITRVRSTADLEQMRAAAEAAGKPQVLLFTDKEAATPVYKGLSMQLRRGLAFGMVVVAAGDEGGPAAEREGVLRKFGVESLPSLLVVKAGGAVETYTGENKAPALGEFLMGFMSSEALGAGGGSAGADGEGPDGSGKATAWSFVRQVDSLIADLPSLEAREDMTLLAVHGADGEEGCQVARETFLAAAGEMQEAEQADWTERNGAPYPTCPDPTPPAVVDTWLASVPPEDLAPGSKGAAALSRIGVEVKELAENPCELQVVLLPFGKGKADIQLRYTGPPDGKELQRWVTAELPPEAHRVVQLTDDVTSDFLTTDPSEGKMGVAPKADLSHYNRDRQSSWGVLLFTNRDEVPGVYKALAVALRDRANMAFGWVQANSPAARSTINSFKPPRVPALLVVLPTIVPGDEDAEGSGGGGGPRVSFGMQPYFGPLKYGPMRAFLEQLAEQIEASAGVVTDPGVIEKTLPQITNQAEFQSYCTEPAGMCLLALLDRTAPGFEDERKHLLAAASFGVLSSDLPVLVALSTRRMRFGVLHSREAESSRGSPRLRPELVSRFITDVLSAKIRTQPLQDLPEIRKGDTSSDHAAARDTGRAAAPEEPAAGAGAVEEEFDLNDILSEEVEGGAGLGGTKAERLQEIEEQLKAEEEARRAAEKAKKSSSKKKKKKGGKKSNKSKEEL
ncbi:hypothetical protein VOLCADRAFT_108380 [Volvox carteri f. nagariensis]|uniref:Thioredoxin domain-containing protein n=1 Tax=Volvox carteri f. nagariensis TaxID=3068 RepID=D8UJT0_VOLCA|nr:uncharacterized protein VOLCADRAFT_108380 [Volvox carteri f. nagariensis]EFJ40007.1 hypothetical protein VOLCADRAFT_108380 [Volvox carteri f. nagariensis]|eukprot:XP_002958927.1 hypothetical protein VOLCADRAFT_108380 [Volvox carteri f. nagariensis]